MRPQDVKATPSSGPVPSTYYPAVQNGGEHPDMSGKQRALKTQSPASKETPVVFNAKSMQLEGMPPPQQSASAVKKVPNGTSHAAPSPAYVNGAAKMKSNGQASKEVAKPEAVTQSVAEATHMAPTGVKSDADKIMRRGRGRGSGYKTAATSEGAGRGARPASRGPAVTPGPAKPPAVIGAPQGSSVAAPSSPPAQTLPLQAAATAAPSLSPRGQLTTVTVASRSQPAIVPPKVATGSVSQSPPPAVAAPPRGATVPATRVALPQAGARTKTVPTSRQPAAARSQYGAGKPVNPPAAAAPSGDGSTPVSTNHEAAAPIAVAEKAQPAMPATQNELNGPAGPPGAEDVEVKEKATATAAVAKPPAWVGNNPASVLAPPPPGAAIGAVAAGFDWPEVPANPVSGGQEWALARKSGGRRRKVKHPGKGISNPDNKCFAATMMQVVMHSGEMNELWAAWSSATPSKQPLISSLVKFREAYWDPADKGPLSGAWMPSILDAMTKKKFREGEQDIEEFFSDLVEQLLQEEKTLMQSESGEDGEWREVRRGRTSRSAGASLEKVFAMTIKGQLEKQYSYRLQCPKPDAQQTSEEVSNLQPLGGTVVDTGSCVVVVLPVSAMKSPPKRHCQLEFGTELVPAWLQVSNKKLKLKSMIFHQGETILKGHYFCVINIDGQWVKFDDTNHYVIHEDELQVIQTDGTRNGFWIMPFLAVYTPVNKH